jgi:hypothetical protein
MYNQRHAGVKGTSIIQTYRDVNQGLEYLNDRFSHKVRTYKEYHNVCPSSELGLSQPLSRQRVFPSPQTQGGGGTPACGWGVG